MTIPHLMKFILSTCLAAVASLSAFAANSNDDTNALQGKWRPVKAELGGQPMADDVLKIISLKMDNGKYEVFVGDEPDRGTYSVDSTTEPKAITVVGTDGPNKGRTFPAIYELNGDTLRICYDLSGAKRPTEFKSATDTKLYLVTYSRKTD
jgi:uncharacterized protein (TIGR03067 family)